MTGNIALDIFISLAFIYLLYSLYATVIVEILASFLRLRAKNLEYAIKRMLTDDEKIAFFDGLKGIFNLKFFEKNRKRDKLFNRFFEQPTIKYLSKPGLIWNRRPSYLARHSFSKALIDSIKENGDGNTLVAKITSGIDSCPMDNNTRKHLKSLLEDANNDIQKFKILLEQWFNDTMERSVGWYKRNIQFILLVIGFVLAIAFNVNTIHITKLLSKDSKAREQLINLATGAVSKYEGQLLFLGQSTGIDTAQLDTIRSRLDTLMNIKKGLEADIRETQVLFGGGWGLPDSISLMKDTVKIGSARNYFRELIKNDTLIQNKLKKKVDVDSGIFYKSFVLKKEKCKKEDNQKRRIRYEYSFSAFKYKIKYTWGNLAGYLLTALAISLGSPFWFDLLNKLIKLRGSVRQPVASEENDKPAGQVNNTSDNPLNRKG